MPLRSDSENFALIRVIGVGGGGSNAVNRMIRAEMMGVEFIACNTDAQALLQSDAPHKIRIGDKITRGLGAGGDAAIGQRAAEEDRDKIAEAIADSDMVFITAGLGGGTGSGAAPVVAEIAKEQGALTIGVVTKPFSFEGRCRARNAEAGWQELQKYADTIITVPNDRLLSVMQKNSRLSDMLSMADNVLLQAVKGITDLINVPGLINADFADLRTVMKEVGPAVMGSGSATGENRATEAARKAIDNQLLEDFGIDGARGLLINISASESSFTMAEFMEASALIQEKVDDDAKVVIGALYDDALGDEMHVTVIATGVGGMINKKETINPVEDHMRRPAAPAKESETVTKGAPAPPNKQPRVTRLPGSNFDALDSLGSSKAPEGKPTSSLNWNDDYLETPTYLRKKAN